MRLAYGRRRLQTGERDFCATRLWERRASNIRYPNALRVKGKTLSHLLRERVEVKEKLRRSVNELSSGRGCSEPARCAAGV
jgi:hypothetical protein